MKTLIPKEKKMLLSELLEKYEGSQAKISDGLVSRDIAAPSIKDKDWSREIRTQRIDNQTRTVIFHYDNPLMLAVWFVDSEQFEPDYIISEVPKRRGRPAQDKVAMTFTLDRIVAEEIQKLPEGDRSAEVSKILRGFFKKTERETTMNATLKQTLESFLASDEFKSAIVASTKASWGGSGYSVELFPDGSHRTLWNNKIGNKYDSPGVILGIPTFTDDGAYDEVNGENPLTEEEYFDLCFDNEGDDLANALREALQI